MALDIGQAQNLADAWLTDPTFTATGMGVVEPSWFERLAKPWTDFGSGLFAGAGEMTAQFNESLPDLLFGDVDQRTRSVRTEPGKTVTYIQPTHPGGEPMTPQLAGIGWPFGLPAPTTTAGKVTSSVGIIAAIGLGLFVLLFMKR